MELILKVIKEYHEYGLETLTPSLGSYIEWRLKTVSSHSTAL